MAMFDPISYFRTLAKTNKICKSNNFVFDLCSDPDSLQGLISNYKTATNFVFASDTVDSNTHSQGIGFFDRQVYTVWILASYKFDDMADREIKLKQCRSVFQQFLSRLIKDKEDMTYDDDLAFLDVQKVYKHELGRYSMSGVTGLYFMINSDEPIDLQFDKSQWEQEQSE